MTVAECERTSLVPVTVTVTVPVDVNVHDRVDEPEPPVTTVGDKVHAELFAVRVTGPVNPLTGEMLIVEVPAELTTTATLVGLAVIVKSGRPVTLYVTVVEWDIEPLVPVTVTVTEPADAKVQDNVEEPEPPVTVTGD